MKVIMNTRSNTLGLNGVPVDLVEIVGARATVKVTKETTLGESELAKVLNGYPKDGRKVDMRVADVQEFLGEYKPQPEVEVSYPFNPSEAVAADADDAVEA